jgi:hypothetical protein
MNASASAAATLGTESAAAVRTSIGLKRGNHNLVSTSPLGSCDVTSVEKWGTFATVAGGAAAGLTGLLFVAVSIRIEAIAKSEELRNRAGETLALFVTVLFVTILISIPDQSYRLLGFELIALAVITGVGFLTLDRRAKVDPNRRDDGAHAIASILDAVAPNAFTAILILVAGFLLVFEVHAGLDVLVLPVIVGLAGGVASAWLLLTRIPE